MTAVTIPPERVVHAKMLQRNPLDGEEMERDSRPGGGDHCGACWRTPVTLYRYAESPGWFCNSRCWLTAMTTCCAHCGQTARLALRELRFAEAWKRPARRPGDTPPVAKRRLVLVA